MNRSMIVGALAVALTVPAQAPAQRAPAAHQHGDAASAQHAQRAIPFLRLSEQLQLTPQQVTRLEEIARQLQEANRPLMEQLQAARQAARTGHAREGERGAQMRQRMERMTPEQRAQMRERMEAERGGEARAQRGERAAGQRLARGQRAGGGHAGLPEELRPLAEQVRQNTQRAMEAARAVLTPQQLEQARQLMRDRSRPHGPRGPAPSSDR